MSYRAIPFHAMHNYIVGLIITMCYGGLGYKQIQRPTALMFTCSFRKGITDAISDSGSL